MNNNAFKVMLVILIVICLFQGCGIANMTEQLEGLEEYIDNLESDIKSLENRIVNLEAGLEQDNMIMDVSYGIEGLDWENGKINVEFVIHLREAYENSKLVIGNGYGTYEFTRSGNQFVGTVEYPMNSESYETIAYQYNGDVLVDSEAIEWIGAGYLMGKYVICEFDGLTSYGNGKLTLAGVIDYYINLEEQVTSAKVVFKDEEIILEDFVQGQQEINWSKEVEAAEGKEGQIDMKYLCLEITTESGMVYRAYPYLSALENYKVNIDEEYIMTAYQENALVVTTPAGATYEMIMGE